MSNNYDRQYLKTGYTYSCQTNVEDKYWPRVFKCQSSIVALHNMTILKWLIQINVNLPLQ